MEKGSSSSTPTSGIEAIFSSIQSALLTIAKPIVQQSEAFNTNDNTLHPDLLRYLKSYVIYNETIENAFNKIALLSNSNPKQSFAEIRKFFTQISLNTQEPITKIKLPTAHWIQRASDKKQSILTYRIALFYLSERYLADIAIKLANNCSGDKIEFLLSEYITSIEDAVSDFTHYITYTLMVEGFEKLFYYLSLKIPEKCWQFLLRVLQDRQISSSSHIFLYKMMRSFTFKNTKIDYTESRESLSALNNALVAFATPQPIVDSSIASALFFASLTADALTTEGNNRPVHLVQIIYSSATTNQQNPVTFPIVCTLFALSEDGRSVVNLGQIMSTARRIARQTANSQQPILFGLTRILCGKNFQPHCVEFTNTDFLQWQADPHDVSKLTDFFSVISSFQNFDNTKLELANYITMIAVNGMQSFVDGYIQDLGNPTFIKQNGIALFQVGCYLIPTGNDKLLKCYTELVDKFIESCSLEERATTICGIPTTPCSDTELFETSIPVIPSSITQHRMSSDIAKLQKTVSPDNKKPFSYDPKFDLKFITDSSKVDSPLARCISLIPLLEYNENLVNFVTQRIYDGQSFICSLSARCLMVLSIKYKDNVVSIIKSIVNQIPQNLEQCFIQLQTMQMILEQIHDDEILEKVTETIIPTIISGLSCPSYEVRSAALDVIELTPLNKFFEQNEKILQQKTLEKIASVFNSDCDPGVLKQLPFQSFKEYALTHYEIFYHIYLSVVFSLIVQKEEYKYIQNSNQQIYSMLQQVFGYCDKHKYASLHAINIATFLACSADNNETNDKNLQQILQKTIQIISDQIKVNPFNAILYSFASSIHKSHTMMMLKLLANANELFLRCFTFVAQINVQNTSFIGDPQHMEEVLKLMDNVVKYCENNKIISTVSLSPIGELSELMFECLTSLMHVIEIICQQFKDCNASPIAGPFLHRPFIQKSLNRSNWFYFMFNLATPDQKIPNKLKIAAKSAFAAFCSVNTIPDDLFENLIDHVLKIAQQNISACSYILSHSFSFFLGHFINKSFSEPHFFSCIAMQFPQPQTIEADSILLAAAARKQLSSNEQEFSDSVFSHIGDLLALCFFFLSGEKQGYEEDAQKVLYHIILSGSLLIDSPFFAEALDFIHEKSYVGLTKLSGILSNAFEMCIEQFISQSLSILNDRFLTTFANIILPWFKHVNLISDATSISLSTQPAFQRFTAMSFMQQFTRVVCLSPLQPSAISIIDYVTSTPESCEFAFIFCFTAYSECKEQCKTLLIHLCKSHKDIAMNVLSYLQFRYWFYSVIQLRTFDRFFDFDKFLNEMKSEKDQQQTTSSLDPNVAEENAMFALEVCLELVDLYEDEFKPTILSFCISHKRTDLIAQAFQKITGVESPDSEDIKSLIGDNTVEFFREAFLWSTTCGDTETAVQACKYAIETVTAPNIHMLEHVLKTIRITVQVLRENSVPSSEKRQKKHLAKLLQGDEEVNLKIYYKHLSLLIELLAEICKSLNTVPQSAFNAVISFASCGDSEFQPIFDNFVKITNEFLTISDKIKDSTESGGILMKIAQYNILLDKKKAKKIIDRLFHMTSVLFERKFINCLMPTKTDFVDQIDEKTAGKEYKVTKEMAAATIVLFLIPYLSQTISNEEFNSIKVSAMELLGIDISCFKHLDTTDGFEETVEELMKTAGDNLTGAVVKLYSLIMNHTTHYSPMIYKVSAVMIDKHQNPINLSLKRIATHAIKDKSAKSSKSLEKFLPLYQTKIGLFDALPALFYGSAFPVENICKDVAKWEKEEFPYYPTECTFFYFNAIEDLRNECLQIKVDLFDRWNDIAFHAIPQRPNTDMAIGVVPEVSELTIKQFITKVNKKTNLLSSSSEKLRASISSESEERIPQVEEQSLLVVPVSTFTPTIAEINRMCIDITGNLFE
ncbi:hypothetical protein TVAG_152670 [Trichomonas vaginalis G3]|uniref:Uncharacterized protein n=1 Tax=Trichomonas vaginalis (strain ATCC PRA-98 / G3) TaxID=412133 RepID=A2FWL5_TRIV3|nr:armadillo (ARM) repeat-containing protein family [Trichomonas vaginalis G3]EAX90700.1 hypothetical protein TVAG_152670 [Trichomonas vaginalis G3]KAI5493039.1 armadillo (ARM) repeat-containing protein family [Trichomonas vaginalis G3]|eukprot:XP_001303630.1 hypothetical protein [Trichomonas vaginalis G3]